MHRWQYRSIFIRFAVVASQICEITRNSEKIRTYSSSRSSKVISLGANRKRICNFLLVVNSTLDVSRTVFEILTHKARRPLTRDRPYCPLTFPFYRDLDRISAQTLYRQKLQCLLKICTADSICLSVLVFTQLFPQVARWQAAKPARKQILARNSQSRSFKVIHFGVTGKATRD